MLLFWNDAPMTSSILTTAWNLESNGPKLVAKQESQESSHDAAYMYCINANRSLIGNSRNQSKINKLAPALWYVD